jgi:hypothetical protein
VKENRRADINGSVLDKEGKKKKLSLIPIKNNRSGLKKKESLGFFSEKKMQYGQAGIPMGYAPQGYMPQIAEMPYGCGTDKYGCGSCNSDKFGGGGAGAKYGSKRRAKKEISEGMDDPYKDLEEKLARSKIPNPLLHGTSTNAKRRKYGSRKNKPRKSPKRTRTTKKRTTRSRTAAKRRRNQSPRVY